MKSKNTLIGTVLTIALLLSTAAPALAVGANDDGLSVDVDQGDDVVVTVEREITVNNTTEVVAAENASVTVEALNNSTYAADRSFTTDENGTAILPDPQENVTVVVTATWNNSTAETEANLVVTNTSDDGEEQEFSNFGQRLSAFVHRMLNAGDTEGPLGQLVSQFARENNPGADHRNEHAAKGQEKKDEKRDDHAKKGDGREKNADGNEKKGGKDKAKKHDGKEKKEEKRNDHAKKNGKQGDDEETTTTTD